jgi:hypothetical protein
MRYARIGVAFGLFILIGINLGGGGVLLPVQIDDYGVDKTTIGAIFWASSLGYGLAAAANGASGPTFSAEPAWRWRRRPP